MSTHITNTFYISQFHLTDVSPKSISKFPKRWKRPLNFSSFWYFWMWRGEPDDLQCCTVLNTHSYLRVWARHDLLHNYIFFSNASSLLILILYGEYFWAVFTKNLNGQLHISALLKSPSWCSAHPNASLVRPCTGHFRRCLPPDFTTTTSPGFPLEQRDLFSCIHFREKLWRLVVSNIITTIKIIHKKITQGNTSLPFILFNENKIF